MASLNLRERSPGLWRLRVRVGRRDHYRHVRGDQAAARAAGEAWLAEVQAEGAAPASAATPLAGWMRQCMRLETHLEARTRERYEEVVRLHVEPHLGQRRLSAVTAAEAQGWMAALLADGVGPSTVREACRQVRAALERAVELRVLAGNPLRRLRAPRPQEPRRQEPLRPGQLQAAQAAGADRVAELVALALATGARRGELLALQWRHLDLDAGAVRVEQALELLRDGTVRVKPPKTRAGRRSITLPQAALPRLRAWRARQAEAALRAGVPLEDLPVFPGDGAGWWHPRAATKASRRALRAAGLDAGLHSLRHTHASNLLSAGATPSSVQARLGHARLATTLGVYGAALPHDDARAAELMGELLEGRRARR